MSEDFNHAVINPAVEYVRGIVRTNTMENLCSLVKRGLSGTYVSVEPFQLFRYLDERAFRYNNRDITGANRFRTVCRHIAGSRLTWNQLTGTEQKA